MQEFLKYKDVSVFETRHSIIQKQLPERSISDQNIEYIAKKGIEVYSKQKAGTEEFLIFSKKLNQGIVFDYREYTKKNKVTSKIIIDKQFIIITILPKGRRYNKPGTKVIFVESYIKDHYSQAFVNYVNSLIGNKIKPEDKKYDYNPIVLDKDITFVFFNNKLEDVRYDNIGIDVFEID